LWCFLLQLLELAPPLVAALVEEAEALAGTVGVPVVLFWPEHCLLVLVLRPSLLVLLVGEVVEEGLAHGLQLLVGVGVEEEERLILFLSSTLGSELFFRLFRRALVAHTRRCLITC
jgi:hypothetical protein